MASTKGYMMARRATSTTNYRFLSTETTPKTTHAHSNSFDLNEADVWGGSTQSNSAEFRSLPPSSRKLIARPRRYGGVGVGEASSLPVNVPDWSKILRDEYKDKWSAAVDFGGSSDFHGCDDGGDDEWVPPHEYLARTRNASLSVQEGIGRTLKGRDLSRVRNAIWEKTGFQD